MKILPEHYSILREAVRATLAQYPGSRESYANQGLSDKRFRWDLLNATQVNGISGNQWVCNTLYSYANDEHIDTALRRIVKDLEA